MATRPCSQSTSHAPTTGIVNGEEVDDGHFETEHGITVNNLVSQVLSPRGQEARYCLPKGVISGRGTIRRQKSLSSVTVLISTTSSKTISTLCHHSPNLSVHFCMDSEE